MYTADEPYRTLSMKYLDRFTIASTNAEIQRFISFEDIIEINISENRNDPRGSYYTFFMRSPMLLIIIMVLIMDMMAFCQIHLR